MRRITERVAVALNAMKVRCPDEYKIIQQWFLESLQDMDHALRKRESAVEIYRAQGASRELLDFCEIAADPADVAGKLRMEKAGVHAIPSK